MTWLASIKHWLNKPRHEVQAAACYAAIVAQARRPGFYARIAVPDTPQGRFELVMLHAALVVARMAEQTAFTQALFDIMFADFDVNLRELGVGDLGVGKRVHSWAQAFHGRTFAYNAALSDQTVLATSLQRNINISERDATLLAAYVQQAATALHQTSDEQIISGQIAWPTLRTEDDNRTESAA